MAVLEISTLTDGTLAYEQHVSLEGEEWLLSFAFNTRRQRWSYGIQDAAGTQVLAGATIVTGVPLNRRAVGGPPGRFWAVSETDDDSDPALVDLGARVRFVYEESE